MEDTLRDLKNRSNFGSLSLNPCFNGRYSQRSVEMDYSKDWHFVLILVLMEDTLRDYDKRRVQVYSQS